MKVLELKENDPLEVIEISKHITYDAFDSDFDDKVWERKMLQTKIITDDDIVTEDNEETRSIKEYHIGKKKQVYDEATLKTNKVYLKKHNFVITYLIATEFTTLGRVHGWFDIIKDITIYLNDKKNKKVLKCAKNIIKLIDNENNKVDYSSIYAMLFSKSNIQVNMDIKKETENVYKLKR